MAIFVISPSVFTSITSNIHTLEIEDLCYDFSKQSGMTVVLDLSGI